MAWHMLHFEYENLCDTTICYEMMELKEDPERP